MVPLSLSGISGSLKSEIRRWLFFGMEKCLVFGDKHGWIFILFVVWGEIPQNYFLRCCLALLCAHRRMVKTPKLDTNYINEEIIGQDVNRRTNILHSCWYNRGQATVMYTWLGVLWFTRYEWNSSCSAIPSQGPISSVQGKCDKASGVRFFINVCDTNFMYT